MGSEMTETPHALDIFLVKEKVKLPEKVDDNEIIWERKDSKRVDIDWHGKGNCLTCAYEKMCNMSYKTEVERKKQRLMGDKVDECPYNFWKDYTRFIGWYNTRNEFLARTTVPIPEKYFIRWSFKHEIDIYKDKFANFYERIKMLWWIIASFFFVARWKWIDYWMVRTRKTVFLGFMFGMMVGFMLSNLLLWITAW